jgi:hypothetical protein
VLARTAVTAMRHHVQRRNSLGVMPGQCEVQREVAMLGPDRHHVKHEQRRKQLPVTVWLSVYVTRARSRSAGPIEALTILALSLAAPVQAAAGVGGNSWYVAQWAVHRRVVDLRAMQQFSLQVLRTARQDAPGAEQGRTCVSMGIAALVPNKVQPDDVVDGGRSLAGCKLVLLQNGDMSYPPLRARAEAEWMQLVMSRDTAELWQRRRK